MIIYDDNLSCRSLSQAKRKIYFFLLSLFERKDRKDRFHVFCERFKTCFLNENHPEQFALRLHEAFWVLRFTGYGALIILRSAVRLCYFALCPLQTTYMQPVPLAPRVLKDRKKVEKPRPPTLKNSRYTQWMTSQ